MSAHQDSISAILRDHHLEGCEAALGAYIDALYERAAKLPKVELTEPRALIGKSTVEAIRSGIVFGFAGQVDGIVRRLRDELGADTTVLATGGLARALIPAVRETIDQVDELLTLTGLRLIWERNVPPDGGARA